MNADLKLMDDSLPLDLYGRMHNVYLQYAAERGIPGLGAFLWFLGKMLVDYIRALRRTPADDPERRWILQGCIAVMLGVLTAAVIELWRPHRRLAKCPPARLDSREGDILQAGATYELPESAVAIGMRPCPDQRDVCSSAALPCVPQHGALR